MMTIHTSPRTASTSTSASAAVSNSTIVSSTSSTSSSGGDRTSSSTTDTPTAILTDSTSSSRNSRFHPFSRTATTAAATTMEQLSNAKALPLPLPLSSRGSTSGGIGMRDSKVKEVHAKEDIDMHMHMDIPTKTKHPSKPPPNATIPSLTGMSRGARNVHKTNHGNHTNNNNSNSNDNNNKIHKKKKNPTVHHNHGNNTNSKILDVLDIPDPPTPDERNHAKTAAAALALRKRRKSRRLSWNQKAMTVFPPTATSQGADADADQDGGVHAAPSPARARTVTMESQLKDVGLLVSTSTSTSTFTARSVMDPVTDADDIGASHDGSQKQRDSLDQHENEHEHEHDHADETDSDSIVNREKHSLDATHHDTTTFEDADSSCAANNDDHHNVNSHTTMNTNMDDSNMDWAEGDDSIDTTADVDLHDPAPHIPVPAGPGSTHTKSNSHHVINDHDEEEEDGDQNDQDEGEIVAGTPLATSQTDAYYMMQQQQQRQQDDDKEQRVNHVRQTICFDDDDDSDGDEVFLTPLKHSKLDHEKKLKRTPVCNDHDDGDANDNGDRIVFSSGKKKRPRRGNHESISSLSSKLKGSGSGHGGRQSMLIPDQDDLQTVRMGVVVVENHTTTGRDNGIKIDANAEIEGFDDRDTDEMASPLKRSRRSRKRSTGRKSMILPSESGLELGMEFKTDDTNVGFLGGSTSTSTSSTRKNLARAHRENHDRRHQPVQTLLKAKANTHPADRDVHVDVDTDTDVDETAIKTSVNARSTTSPFKVFDKSTKMKEIKAAIRKYCALPQTQRYKSNEAIIVEELTGYPLISSMDKINRQEMEKGSIQSPIRLNWASTHSSSMSPSSLVKLSNELKRNLFEKIKPLVQVMEKKKKEDIAFLEDATGCRVERKRSKFRYLSLTTGKKVSAREYERRYLFKIQEQRDARLLEMQQHMSQVDDTDPIDCACGGDSDVDIGGENKMRANSTRDEGAVASAITSDEEDKSHGRGNVEKRSLKKSSPSSPSPRRESQESFFEDWLPVCDDSSFDIPTKEEIMADPELAEAKRKMHEAFADAERKMQEAFNKAAEEYARTVQLVRSKKKCRK